MLLGGPCGGDQVGVPLIGFHREKNVKAGIGKKPCVGCYLGSAVCGLAYRPLFDVANGCKACAGVRDDTATGFEKNCDVADEMAGIGPACGLTYHCPSVPDRIGWIVVRFEHFTLLCWKLIS